MTRDRVLCRNIPVRDRHGARALGMRDGVEMNARVKDGKLEVRDGIMRPAHPEPNLEG